MDRFELLRGELSRRCPELELRSGEPMSRHTSFRIGGPAALMALPKTAEEAAAALAVSHELGIEPFFLGNGSNLLVPDEGVERFLIKPVSGMDRCRREGNVIFAQSGVSLARLAVFARDNGLTGLEFAHGIPGSLGGAVTMNAGAYGGEMVQVVRSVTCLNRKGERETVTDFDFGYRRSAFSDGRRMVSVLKKGKLGECLTSVCDWLLPRASEGIFEWSDLKSSIGYLRSYLQRGLH